MKLRITVQNQTYDVDVQVLDESASAPAAAPAAPLVGAAATPPPAGPVEKDVTSPIAGNVFRVLVTPGDTVKPNDTLLVLEAMKMESNVASPAAGTIAEVAVKEGDAVTQGQLLLRFA